MEGLNTDTRVFSTPDNHHFTVEEYKTIIPKEMYEGPLETIAKTRRLDLKIEELYSVPYLLRLQVILVFYFIE